ncbi:MAG: sigma-E factor negative regulatory protein [Xanthomonadales bacterium]|uniref:sigma-E factor negative regulatory protein n=2 Tax=Dokdonella sp. TaxID=2291710 RepID=UPI002BF7F745|nr:sigma-E factor negative regulatory protein [Xanthomonadales bacterium]HQW75513.1 sigma-E factor negative regulatory protein [Dokdonella sp.]MBK7208785.1 sigma-E factor negative regulatory protein [Xanthomonadales bacterium]HQX65842.1 sigma-E factor negative regulatory protein [Dokdonella sp.]HQY53772.1 sigma-E factor negative regulatory protein [Dokdonella sp.]
MSQQIREQLSTLMDGELARDETLFLMRSLQQKDELANSWSNYHLTRQVLRRQDVFLLPADFSHRILSQLDGESVHVTHAGRWLRWAGGGAIAASVAVVALLFSGPRGGQGDVPGEPLAASANATQQPAPMAAPRPGEFRAPLISPALDVQPASVSTQGFASPSAPIDPRLQSYLIRHYDAAAGNGQSAMLPYVLLVVPPPQPSAGDADEGTIERR